MHGEYKVPGGKAARRNGVTVVRRISGGGAMFVEPGNTITYSLYVPDALVQGMTFADSYAFLDDRMIAHFGGRYGLTEDRLTADEFDAADKRVAAKSAARSGRPGCPDRCGGL